MLATYGPTWGCGSIVMAFDRNGPLWHRDAEKHPEAPHRTAPGPAAGKPEASGQHGDPRMIQALQVSAHDTV